MQDSRWLLPDGVDELVPPAADALEGLRRELLDLMQTWGYALCVPATVEFLESLLLAGDTDLELQTFKLIDQASGRLLGLPADMTPQIARIDAHRIGAEAPTRLCYLGQVLHTQPDKFAGSRNPLQLGAELYGHTGIESDAEIIRLMVEVLSHAGVGEITLDLCHMGIFHGLSQAAALTAADEAALLEVLLRKAAGELPALLGRVGAGPEAARWFTALLALNGDASVLSRAREVLADAPAAVGSALSDLEALVASLALDCPDLSLHLDLADLRGYQYHTGVMFAAYTPRMGRAIARGGRYDNIGLRFGRARAATGFSTDLKRLADLGVARLGRPASVYAPADPAPDLRKAVAEARAAGRIVVQGLPGQAGGARELGCTLEFRRGPDGHWQVRDLA